MSKKSKARLKESPPLKIRRGPVTTGEGTVKDAFDDSCDRYRDKILFRWRNVVKEHVEVAPKTGKELITYEYDEGHEWTYGEVQEKVGNFGKGLVQFDKTLKMGSRVGIYANTCKEWVISLHAISGMSMTVTTVYATLGWDNLVLCLNEAELSTIICEAKNIPNIDKYLGEEGNCPFLKRLVVIGKMEHESKYFEAKMFDDIVKDGEKAEPHGFPGPKPDDLALIMYTSGTTGNPKGVMIPQRSIVGAITGFTDRLKFCAQDTHFSYLPLAHIFELAVNSSVIFNGGCIAFGNPRTLVAKPGGAKNVGDLAWAKPTILCGVPKVWETIKKAVFAKVRKAGGIKAKMFHWVLGRKLSYLKNGENVDVFLEGVAFKNIRAMVGGNVRFLVSGGAPLSGDTQLFLQAVLGSKTSVVQGYGLTETVAGGTIQFLKPRKYTVENIGYPICCLELKILAVPDLEYFVDGKVKKGELLIRGSNISRGYFRRPDLTSEAYDEKGWFHTGDIVRFNEDQSITIIDRRKNLVKLSHGEYVAVEALEVKYGGSVFCQPNGVYVHVDPSMDNVVAVILADPTYAFEFASKNEIGGGSIQDIIGHPKYLAAMEKDFLRIAEEEKVTKYEVLSKKRFVVRSDLWTPENGLLTAASKLKRRSLREKYAREIGNMYEGKVDMAKKEEEEEEGEDDEEVQQIEKGIEDEVPEHFKSLKPVDGTE